MGWDTTFLQKVLSTCTSGASAGSITECPLFELVGFEETSRCAFKVPQGLVNEDIKGPFKLMPGGIKADR